jgi:hypothetical protein
MTAIANGQNLEFKSERLTKSATIRINGRVEKVFPLFGPVREAEWAYGWNPQLVFPKDIEVEEHMIFQTESHNDNESHYTWTLSKYQPVEHKVVYTVYTENRIWFIGVSCRASGDQTATEVTYTYTGLNEIGNRLNKEAMDKMFAHNLKDWELALNHYLKTGKILKEGH